MSNDLKVAAVRRFNRFYTATIGVLGDGIQRTPYSLTEARLIFELAQVSQAETLKLRTDLGLDPGYLSRILSRFEADGIVELGRSTVDSRRQTVSLTPHGRAVFAMLDQHAVQDMGRLLEKLDDVGQTDLLDAMALIERLWAAPEKPRITLRGLRPGDLGWIVQRHGVIYAREYDHDQAFEAMVATIVGDYGKSHDESCENAWIAEVDGTAAGSVFCVRRDETTAQLRLLLLEPWARGLGLGKLLVNTCVDFARQAGYREMVLFTISSLTAARRLYEQAGFRLVSEEQADQFGAVRTQQWFSLTIPSDGA